jgi:hypothetical protein
MIDHAFCPQCHEGITRTRQIAVTSGISSPGEAPWFFRPQSPPLPEVVPPQIDPSVRRGGTPTTTLSGSKWGLLSQFISSSPATKKQKPSRSSMSATSLDGPGSTLPRHLSFCFSLSGKNLILWKKDSQALVRIEVESRGSRLLDLAHMLPASDEVRTVNIRYVAEGNDWICVLISYNRVWCWYSN